jgi:NADPH:quinone reductase
MRALTFSTFGGPDVLERREVPDPLLAPGSAIVRTRAIGLNFADVFYGFAGDAPSPVDPRVLMDGSKTLTGGDLWSWLRTREDRLSRAAELFEQVRRGDLRASIAARVPLAEGARAHALIESRATSGKVLLIP